MTRMERFHPVYCWWKRNGEMIVKIAKIIGFVLAFIAINNLLGLIGGIVD